MSNTCDYPKLYIYLKDNLNKFQNSLHKPEDPSKPADYEGNILHTIFFKEYRRSTWYFQYPELISSSYIGDINNGSHLYSYKIKTNSHMFYNSDICQKLPSIQCQAGFKAKWTKNPGSNIVESAELTFNDVRIQGFDYIFIDTYKEFMLTHNQKIDYNINVGNIEMFEEFSDKIPQYDTSFKPPWFYQDITKAFPLYYCSMLDRVEHKIVLRRNINDLLIVVDSEGNKVEADSTSLLKINDMDLIAENSTLPLPQMWGTYIYLSDIECDFNKNVCEKNDSLHKMNNIYHFTDIIKLENENPIQLNNNISIKIQNTEFPITNISWVAQNQNALSEKYYSNYTTCSENSKEGWSPICHSTLNYGKSLIFKEMPYHRTQRVYPSTHCMSIPAENGFNNWCVGLSNSNENHIPGIIIKDGYINIKLLDTNPMLKFKSGEKCEDYFKVYVLLYCSKRLIFDNFTIDDRVRNTSLQTSGTQIIIEGFE